MGKTIENAKRKKRRLFRPMLEMWIKNIIKMFKKQKKNLIWYFYCI